MTDDRRIAEDPWADRELWDLVAAVPVPRAADDFLPRLTRRIQSSTPRALPGAPARMRRGPRRRLLASVAVVAAVAAIAAAVVLTGRHTVRELQNPAAASAAEIVTNVKTALRSVKTIRATVVRPHYDPDGRESGDGERRQILATADGRMRYGAPTARAFVKITDLATGVMSVSLPPSVNETTGERENASRVVTGCPLGMPDRSDLDEDDIDSRLFALWFQGNVMSAMAHGTVTETTYEGRPALTVTTAADPSVDSPFDAVEVTVDRAAWFPVRVRFLRHGKVRQEERLTDLRLNEPLSDQLFEPSFLADAKVERRSASPTWRRLTFAEAANTFAESPLAPRALPTAFAPFAAAVTDRAELRFIVTTAHGGHDERYWSWSRDITSLGYRAGFLTFLVTTRRQETDDPLADPFATLPELAARGNELETVTLEGGALRGIEAQLATPALNTPHLWAYNDGRLITVSGDLTRDQLLTVANSLEPLQ